MAKRKAPNKGRNERAGRTGAEAKSAQRSKRSDEKPAGRATASKRAGKATASRPAETKRPPVKAPAPAKASAAKRRADRRPSEAGQAQQSLQGPDTGSVVAGKNGRVRGPAVPGHEAIGDTVPKTNLSAADLAEFRELLLEKRRELVGDMNNMSDEARRSGAPGGTVSSMPIHMADLGSDTWEQELTLGLIENERTLLREIDEALDRIENKTYGICIATHKPIGKARLRFKPWAKYCIEYARKREQGLA